MQHPWLADVCSQPSPGTSELLARLLQLLETAGPIYTLPRVTPGNQGNIWDAQTKPVREAPKTFEERDSWKQRTSCLDGRALSIDMWGITINLF